MASLFSRLLLSTGAKRSTTAFSGAALASVGLAWCFSDRFTHSDERAAVHCKELQQPAALNHFDFSVQMLHHPNKLITGGEDAYYAEKNLIAVADGIGRWASKGIDPKEHSNSLIDNIEKYYKSNVLKYLQNPKLLLIHSAKETRVMGSSTIVVVTIDKERKVLKASQMGDCGFCVYRLDDKNVPRLIHSLKEHDKSFNLPYQIGTAGYGDSPVSALEYEHLVEDKDIVVVGSDGLFDNLDAQQIRQAVSVNVINDNKLVDVQGLAQDIAKTAKQHSLQWFYDSPFAKKLKQDTPTHQPYMGGKKDDITVIVAQVNLH